MTKIIGTPTLDDALDALAEEVKARESCGQRTLVFCEDRLTLLAERRILEKTGGTFLTEISTFRRFLSRTKSGEIRTLSKQGSVLEIAALLGAHHDALGCFKRSAAQAVYETIAQLSASCVTEDLLEKSAEETGGVLRRKLTDLSFLLGKYHDFLRENALLDENGYLALLPERIDSGILKDTNVIFFAFPSFTRQARNGIRAAIRSARSVTGIFLAGFEEFYTNEAASVFRSVAAEFGEVKAQQRRRPLEGDAAVMHSCLFSLEPPTGRKRTDHVRIFTPADETAEMNEIAARIRKLTAEGKRYRDIAVLVGGQEYFLAVTKAFKAYHIPFFADVKRKFSEHPFCVLALSVLEAVHDGVLPDEADDIASSVYFGESDLYRNYLLRYGAYRGGCRREIRSENELGDAYGDRAALVSCREKMLAILDLFKPKGRERKETGLVYTAAIRKLWELVRGEHVTKELAEMLPEEERALLDISPLEGVLRETEEVVGQERFTPREFATLLRSGLEALTIAILPQRADAVFVGDVTESKISRVDVLFCAGLTDAVPRVAQDTAVITDGEIRGLKKLQVEIEPAIAIVNARAKEALALNLCAFAEEIYLSCPLRKGGAEANRSEIFYYIDRTFDTVPMSEVYPYDCSEFAPALLTFFRDSDALSGEKSALRAEALIDRYSAVREVLQNPDLRKGSDRDDWPSIDPESLIDRRNKEMPLEAGELWLRRDIAPTHLEEYFSCPYKGFALKALRISEREEKLGSADAGSFVHTVLERTARTFNEIEDEDVCRTAARAEAEALLKDSRYAAIADTAAGRYTGERLVEEAAAVTVVAYRQLAQSAYRVRATESDIALPALKLRGKTDRVDESGEFVRVIDYKTGSIDDAPTAYYTGRKLQLELYLRAVSEGGMSAGAFYFPAADDFAGEGENRFRMKGFYCKDEEVVAGFDTAREDGKKSEIYESGSAKGLTREDFENFLDYAYLVSEQAEKEMREGNITPSPYEGTCKYCKLLGMCGFTGEPRKERKAGCTEIVRIVKESAEGGEK